MTRAVGHMDEQIFQKIINESHELSSKIFLHHFGDSLLHPKLADFIRYANQYGIKTFLSANPALLTKRRAQELIDSGLYELTLSLDGLTNETSEAIRGNAARKVDLSEENVLFFLKYRDSVGARLPYLTMQIVKQKQNEHEIELWLAKWAQVKGIDRIKVKSYITWDGQDVYINSLASEKHVSCDISDIVCNKPWTSLTILWDGRVVPCCFDYDGIYVLGDLHEQSLQDIWRGEKVQYLRQCHRDGYRQGIKLCEKCTDMEGHPVRKWYYPLNRILSSRNRLGDEWPVE